MKTLCRSLILIASLLTSAQSFGICTTDSLDKSLLRIDLIKNLSPETRLSEVEASRAVFASEMIACAMTGELISTEASVIAVQSLQRSESREIAQIFKRIEFLQNDETIDQRDLMITNALDQVLEVKSNTKKIIQSIERNTVKR